MGFAFKSALAFFAVGLSSELSAGRFDALDLQSLVGLHHQKTSTAKHLSEVVQHRAHAHQVPLSATFPLKFLGIAGCHVRGALDVIIINIGVVGLAEHFAQPHEIAENLRAEGICLCDDSIVHLGLICLQVHLHFLCEFPHDRDHQVLTMHGCSSSHPTGPRLYAL